MRVVVGSKNPVKIAAVRRAVALAFPNAEIIGASIGASVGRQPWGDAETRRGAVERARRALAVEGGTLGVGLEGGVVETEFGLMTCAWCAVVDANGRLGVGGGVHALLPSEAAAMLREGAELGEAMDRLAGLHNSKQDMGAVGILTDGLTNRTDAYVEIVKYALAPFIRPDLYEFEQS